MAPPTTPAATAPGPQPYPRPRHCAEAGSAAARNARAARVGAATPSRSLDLIILELHDFGSAPSKGPAAQSLWDGFVPLRPLPTHHGSAPLVPDLAREPAAAISTNAGSAGLSLLRSHARK